MKSSPRQLPPPAPYADVEVVDDSYAVDAGDSSSQLFVRRLLTTLRRRWWVPTLTLLLGAAVGIGYVFYIPPTYVSRAQMWEAVKVRLPEGSLFSEDVQNYLGTQSELLQSPTVQGLAVERLRSSGTNAIPMDKDGRPLPVSVRLSQAAKSSVFILSASSPEAAYSRAFLDALMLAYTDYKRDIRKAISGDTLASISEQVQRAERDLKEAQDAFAAYQQTNNLAILQEEGTVAGGYLAQLQTRIADLELEARLLAAASAEPSEGATNSASQWLPAVTVANASIASIPFEIQTAIRQADSLRAQEERLSKVLRPKHPRMVKLKADLDSVTAILEGYRRLHGEQLVAARRSVELKRENVLASIQQWQGKVMESNRKIAAAETLRLRVARAQTVYDRLIVIVQNVGISRNIDQDTMAILENATPARRSYKHEIGVASGTSAGGLALGLAIVALLAYRDDRFNTHTELSPILGSVVGQLPEVPATDKSGSIPLLAPDDPRHGFAESYRSLRSALFYLNSDTNRPSVLLITSAVPAEGKSTVAINLARTIAFGGSKVLLIDADMRRGHLHHDLGAQRGPGLSDILARPDELDAAIQVNGLSHLSVLTRGNDVPNPGDLLQGPAFPALLESLRKRFDFILIDSSPVFAADDASSIAPRADGTLFVVRRSFSRSAIVQEALDTLLQRQARILGLVFNRADTQSRSYHYYQYKDYHRERAS